MKSKESILYILSLFFLTFSGFSAPKNSEFLPGNLNVGLEIFMLTLFFFIFYTLYKIMKEKRLQSATVVMKYAFLGFIFLFTYRIPHIAFNFGLYHNVKYQSVDFFSNIIFLLAILCFLQVANKYMKFLHNNNLSKFNKKEITEIIIYLLIAIIISVFTENLNLLFEKYVIGSIFARFHTLFLVMGLLCIITIIKFYVATQFCKKLEKKNKLRLQASKKFTYLFLVFTFLLLLFILHEAASHIYGTKGIYDRNLELIEQIYGILVLLYVSYIFKHKREDLMNEKK